MKWIAMTAWLICATVVAASLDSVPDPPAVDPNQIEAKAIGTNSQLESSAYQLPERNFSHSSIYFATWRPEFKNVFEPSLSAYRAQVVRLATDSSPPAESF